LANDNKVVSKMIMLMLEFGLTLQISSHLAASIGSPDHFL
jgi:hypothetical protein